MLATLQIVTLLQGFFLVIVLLNKRRTFSKSTSWLLLGAIISIMFFLAGDDGNNLFSENIDWFFFDSSLFITFLFLFVKYYVSEQLVFSRRDWLFFIPNLLYFTVEVIEVLQTSLADYLVVEIFELLIEISFLCYLIFTVKILFHTKKQGWMLYFVIPLTILMSTSIINDILGWFDIAEVSTFSDAAFSTYTMLITAFLFYFITMKLVVSPNQVLLTRKARKYESSGLNKKLVEGYKKKIISFMELENGFKDPKLSLTTLSMNLSIPKQYISEILNVHLNTNFQDFVNRYRVDAFIESLQNDRNDHFTLMGIAKGVGFNSRSSFYTTFRKFKGVTPLEFKKSYVVS